jgi:hypothetical protein
VTENVTDTTPALFDRLADRYDQIIPFFAAFAGQLLEVLDPDPGTRLLDIGGGPWMRRHRGGCGASHGVAARSGPSRD